MSQKGEFTIPPLTVSIDGNNTSSNEVSFSVTEASSQIGSGNIPSTNPREQDPNKQTNEKEYPKVFIKRTLSKTNPYVGEMIVHTVYIYHRVSLQKASAIGDKASDFRTFEVGQEQKRERIGPYFYDVTIWQELLFPLKAGATQLPPY